MAVRSCAEGGAGAPGGHRITGDPTRGCRGGAGRGLRLGAAGAGHDRHGPGAGGLGPPSSPAGSAGAGPPCPARSAAGPAWGGVYRRAAAQAAARAPLARPKIRKPAPIRPCASGSSTRPGDRVSPRQIAARLRFENPDDGSMRICHEQIYQALYVQGAGSLRAQLRVEGALRTGRTRRTPALPTGRRSPSPGARAGYRGAAHRSAPAPGARRGRRSRFVLITRPAAGHRTRTVTDAPGSMVDSPPRAVYSTITWDRGAEMAGHAAFTLATDPPEDKCEFQLHFQDQLPRVHPRGAAQASGPARTDSSCARSRTNSPSSGRTKARSPLAGAAMISAARSRAR